MADNSSVVPGYDVEQVKYDSTNGVFTSTACGTGNGGDAAATLDSATRYTVAGKPVGKGDMTGVWPATVSYHVTIAGGQGTFTFTGFNATGTISVAPTQSGGEAALTSGTNNCTNQFSVSGSGAGTRPRKLTSSAPPRHRTRGGALLRRGDHRVFHASQPVRRPTGRDDASRFGLRTA